MPSREQRIVRELRRAGFTVLTRKQWGSRKRGLYATRRVTRRFVGAADHFFAHITVTEAGSDPKAAMRSLEAIGASRFGTGVSYNWAVHEPSRTILVGQPLTAAGAHTLNDKNVPGFPSNLNYFGHAVAWIGMPDDPFGKWAVDAYAAIIAAEKKHGAAKKKARLYPHSKFAYKDCPCEQARRRIPEIERRTRTVLAPKKKKAVPAPVVADASDPNRKDWSEMATREEIKEACREAVREELETVRYQDRNQPNVKRSVVGLLLETDKNLAAVKHAVVPEVVEEQA